MNRKLNHFVVFHSSTERKINNKIRWGRYHNLNFNSLGFIDNIIMIGAVLFILMNNCKRVPEKSFVVKTQENKYISPHRFSSRVFLPV